MLFALIFGGPALVLVGWLCFRLPGVPFWTFAPIWRANRYLSPVGVALWIVGLAAPLVGVVALFAPPMVSG
ncbi:hypothetical protein [Pseudoxanthomonas wuyuanensis]